MSDCLNPDCVTDYPVLSWLDPDYCSDACRRVHGPRSVSDPDPLCVRRSCGEPADPRLALYGGYCSSACERLDMQERLQRLGVDLPDEFALRRGPRASVPEARPNPGSRRVRSPPNPSAYQPPGAGPRPTPVPRRSWLDRLLRRTA